MNSSTELVFEHQKDKETLLGSNEDVIRVYLVRHGESALNGKPIVQGQSPAVELTAKGVKQAEDLAQHLAPKLSHLNLRIITSAARRAIDTASPLADLLNQQTAAYPEFLELGSGKWEGVRKDDPECAEEFDKWNRLSAHEKFYSPKMSTGESYSQVALRAIEGLSNILSQLQENETLFLFSHSMLMNAVAIELGGEELSDEPNSPLPYLPIDNGDILMIEIPKGASFREGRLQSFIHSR